MLRESSYVITSNKINPDIKIGVFSDLHLSRIFRKKKLDLIRENLKINNPDYICILGDIIDMTNIFDTDKNLDEALIFFNDIGKIAPVYISLGNHDFSRLENGKWRFDYNEEWFKRLDNIDNIILLDNAIVENDEIRFIGFTSSLQYYFNSKEEDENMLIEEFNKNIPEIKNDKLNILLCHSPMCILNDNVINNIQSLKNIRLILAGHMHNGMVPYSLNRFIKNNIGLIAPQKTLFPDNARGIKEVNIDGNDISMVISGGITKIQESAPKILHFVDNFYSPQIDYIEVKTKKLAR